MFRNEWLLHREPTVQVSVFAKRALVANVLMVFLLLHLFAVAVLHRAGAGDDQDKTFQLND
jgi:hypothetical protein